MESIGARLRKAREEKGVSLDEISQKTKIQKNVLADLEEDRLEKSLGVFYVKNFLKGYANYLGLDSASLLEEYSKTKAKPSQPPRLEIKKQQSRPDYIRHPGFIIAIILCVGLVVLGGMALKKGCSKFQKRTVKKEDRPAIKPAKIPSKKSPQKATQSQKISIPKNEQLRLLATAKKDTWIQIKSDGKVIFQNVLKAGGAEEWRASDKIEMWIGDAGGVSLVLNGYKLGSPGKSGQVIKDIIFTRQGMDTQTR